MPTEIGGGFGGKIRVYLEPVAALLSQKTRQAGEDADEPRRVFEGTGPTPGSSIKVKLGATKDGKFRAGRPTWPTRPAPTPARRRRTDAMCVVACYDIEHVKLDGYDVVVNKPRTQAYRAPERAGGRVRLRAARRRAGREARTSTRSSSG